MAILLNISESKWKRTIRMITFSICVRLIQVLNFVVVMLAISI
jgi:hypothetical protein